MRNISEKICKENQNKFYIQQLFPQNCVIYEKTWKNLVQPDRPQMSM